MFNPFQKNIQKAAITLQQIKEAEKIAVERKIPKGDALHAIVARDNNSILVTRDRHFRKLTDISEYHRPEDLI